MRRKQTWKKMYFLQNIDNTGDIVKQFPFRKEVDLVGMSLSNMSIDPFQLTLTSATHFTAIGHHLGMTI